MAYLSNETLKLAGFKALGENVKISDKASIYNANQIEIGDNSRIDDFCVLSGKISIGKFVHIAPFNLLAGGEKGIYVGDFSGISYSCSIFSRSDDYSGEWLTSPLIPSKFTSVFNASVNIGRHVIVGAKSVIFPGVTLAEGCSVGAMTLITKSTDSWGVYVGIPAKRIKDRKKDMLELEKRLLEELSLAE